MTDRMPLKRRFVCNVLCCLTGNLLTLWRAVVQSFKLWDILDGIAPVACHPFFVSFVRLLRSTSTDILADNARLTLGCPFRLLKMYYDWCPVRCTSRSRWFASVNRDRSHRCRNFSVSRLIISSLLLLFVNYKVVLLNLLTLVQTRLYCGLR